MRGGEGGRSWPRPAPLLAIAWMVGGLGWTLAALLPWRDVGVLSRSSLLDAARFAGGGSLDGVVPVAAAPALLVPPVLGVLLALLAGWGGRPAAVARAGAGLLGAVVAAVLLVVMVATPASAGPGAWLAAAATVVVLTSVVAQVACRRIAPKGGRAH